MSWSSPPSASVPTGWGQVTERAAGPGLPYRSGQEGGRRCAPRPRTGIPRTRGTETFVARDPALIAGEPPRANGEALCDGGSPTRVPWNDTLRKCHGTLHTLATVIRHPFGLQLSSSAAALREGPVRLDDTLALLAGLRVKRIDPLIP
jgi:hypothetical protein